MSSDYTILLNATIQGLESLKRAGVQYVPVDRSTLQELAKPVLRTSSIPVPLPRTEPSRAASAAAAIRASAVKQFASPTDKDAAMQELRCRVLQCYRCAHLATTRKNIVFGVGNIHSPLMFVGEAPGADEDAQGEPFVGNAGQLLTKIIKAMGYSREDVYIANILKCRPDTVGQFSGNRKPTPQEMDTCLPYLLEQIDIVQPKVIVALGSTAMEGLFGKGLGITRLRGNWQSFREIPVMPTYHPSYLLRNQLETEKRKVWEDMLQVLEKLERPISQKQRMFFTKAA